VGGGGRNLAIAEKIMYTGIKAGGLSGYCTIRAVTAFGFVLPVTEARSEVSQGDAGQVCIS
jgi:hypothetical protein